MNKMHDIFMVGAALGVSSYMNGLFPEKPEAKRLRKAVKLAHK